MPDLSRRAMLRAIPSVATATIVPAAALSAATSATAIDLAIQAHKVAWDAFGDTCPFIDEVVARAEGRVVTEQDRAVHAAADRVERDALMAVLTCPCRTVREIATKAAYLLTASAFKDCMPQEEQVDALLQSLAEADNV